MLREGRTGAIHEATDTTLNRKVAIRRFCQQSDSYDTEEYKDRFCELTSQLAGLHHPNLLTVFDAGFDDEGPFIVSQAQEGHLLLEHLHHLGPLSEHDVYQMAQQLLDAIISAHSIERPHGALSLRSILVKQKGYGGNLYKLIDLGLNSLIDNEDQSDFNLADPTIMAPELFDKFEPTPQSDLFTLGQLFYVALIGGHPNAGQDLPMTRSYQQMGQLPAVTDYVAISPQFAQWIHSLMAVKPEMRPQTAEDALKSLAQIVVVPQQAMPAAQPQQAQQAQHPTVQFQF